MPFFKAVRRTRTADVYASLHDPTTQWRVGVQNRVPDQQRQVRKGVYEWYPPALVVEECGFHACAELAALFLGPYGISRDAVVVLEMELGPERVSDGVATVARTATPVRVVSADEVRAALSSEYCELVWVTGEVRRFRNGKLHGKPALEFPDGCTVCYADGVVHRDDGEPAVVTSTRRLWVVRGNTIRDSLC
jgi:hypothetical protein